jgi:putative heme-binding domain-containing protein
MSDTPNRLRILRFPKRPGSPASIVLWISLGLSVSAAEWSRITLRPGTTPESAATESAVRWYRCYVRPQEAMVTPQEKDLWRDSMTLGFPGLEGTVTVWLNGKPIIESGPLVAGQGARFKVPKGILSKDAFNTFVVRWHGPGAATGFPAPPIFAGYFDELPLGPVWEVTATEPGADELLPTQQEPPAAAYTEAQFRPATSPMQVAAAFERGKFVDPETALAALQTEPDLAVDQLLHEPVIAQPTHFSFDARGRLWVSQYRQYPYPAGLKMLSRDKYYRSKYDKVPPAPPHHDRGADVVSVHEDTDGDGRYDRHTRVLDGLNMANAAVSGYGGIWVMHTPYLLFYPDADGDGIPDRAPEVRLAGFGLEDTHSVANGLAWGPDGWLYGAQGSTTTSRIVRPGLDPPDAPGRYTEGCMVWRYHPSQKTYEIFADGSGNTFGLSFDAEGRLYSGHNGGDTRGWHHIQEGLYLKQGKDPGKFGPAPNPYAFGELPMMKSAHSIPRFSHMLCVTEGTALPDRWRGQFFAIDPLHHHVIAAERKRDGSTFSTADRGFPLRTEDLTFRPVFIANAPDGSVYIADFREEYIAHGQNYQSQIDPDTGRLYRLRGRDLPLESDINLAAKSNDALVAALSHPNIWHRQTAVRLLVERRATEVVPALLETLHAAPLHPALEALWALHGLGRLDGALALKTLDHPESMVRAWTIRLLGDAKSLPAAVALRLGDLARTEPDAEVRSQMLSTARRLPAKQALPLAAAVLCRPDDLEDPFIPLMGWFVIESHCATDRDAVLALLGDSSFWAKPSVRQHIVPRLMRRFAEAGTRQDLLVCTRLLAMAPSADDQRALMNGFEQAFAGRALPALPDELAAALTAGGLSSPALRLRQGEAAAVTDALALLADPAADLKSRLETARTLGETRHPGSVATLLHICESDRNHDLRRTALAALTGHEAPEIGQRVLAAWTTMPPDVQPSALNLLVSRPAWALRLLDAIQSGTIDRSSLTPDLIERLRAHADPSLAARLDLALETQSPAPAPDPRLRIDTVRRILGQSPGDAYRGEPLYMTRCGACHTLFFKGGQIGPNLTTYQRDDLGTMLVSIIDPNAEIREGFENHLVTTRDGRALSGFLADRDARGIVLRGFDGTDLSLDHGEIAEMKPVGRSLMPEGLLDGLSDQDLRDLFAYLRQSQPITPQ